MLYEVITVVQFWKGEYFNGPALDNAFFDLFQRLIHNGIGAIHTNEKAIGLGEYGPFKMLADGINESCFNICIVGFF